LPASKTGGKGQEKLFKIMLAFMDMFAILVLYSIIGFFYLDMTVWPKIQTLNDLLNKHASK